MKHLTPYSSVAGELPRIVANNVPEVFITWKEMLELKEDIIKILRDKSHTQYENEMYLNFKLRMVGLKND